MLTIILPFVLCVALIPFLRHAAPPLGLLDHPGAHRAHSQATPLVGGVAIFISLLIASLVNYFSNNELRALFVLVPMSVLFFTGLRDDWKGMRVWSRFGMQALSGFLMVYLAGTEILDLGALASNDVLVLGVLSTFFTVFAVVGGINAMNMVDGIDGLAGSLALTSFLCLLGLTSAIGGGIAYTKLLLICIGVLPAFLLFNLRLPGRVRAMVFMGDSGSMVLGFLVTFFLISFSQGPDRLMTPVTALWIYAIPLMDTVSIIGRRLLRGVSPLSPDRSHIHHVFLAAGFSVNQTVLIITGLHALMGIIGLAGLYIGLHESIMFYTFAVLFLLFHIAMIYCEKTVKWIQQQYVGTMAADVRIDD